MDFFAKAGSGKNFSDGLPSLSSYASTQSTQTPALKTGPNESMLHKLISSPIHTVEQIEMQQRSATPKTDFSGILLSEQIKPIKQCSFNNIKPRSLINQLDQQAEDETSHVNRNGYHQPKDNSRDNSYSASFIEQFLNQSDLSEKPDVAMGKYIIFNY